MRSDLYNMIFKRKSFHLFRNLGTERISADELEDINNFCSALTPLAEDIKVKIKIVKDARKSPRNHEYLILFYSEKKDNYLQNIGYMGEQLDLYLVSKNIGTLWYGIGKPEEATYDGLDFVIMMAIAKVDSPSKFRKDMFKSRRKDLKEIWYGDDYLDIGNIARFAPSACNSQPWLVESSQDQLKVYRFKKPGKRGIMPKDKVDFYNQIDVGIFLCILELCLTNGKISFDRELYIEKDQEAEKNLNAVYNLQG